MQLISVKTAARHILPTPQLISLLGKHGEDEDRGQVRQLGFAFLPPPTAAQVLGLMGKCVI